MVKPPLVTIAMPVFNGGSDLHMAVQSILNQTFEDWELLLIDDGSTDAAIARLNTKSDRRIKIIDDGHNKGLAARLNQAINMARGYYFARMDHDDICHPDRLARQVAFLDAHKDIDLLATQCVTINQESRLIGRYPVAINHVEITRRPWQGFYMPHPTWMGRTAWFQDFFYSESGSYCCEDQELLLRAYRKSVYHTLPEDLLAYRVRENPPMVKLALTRSALFKVQTTYFWGDRALINLGGSFFAFCARLGLDITKKVILKYCGQRLSAKSAGAMTRERAFWDNYIAKLKRQMCN